MPPEANALRNDTETPFDQAVGALSHIGDLRVWSVIVTIFGDLAQNPGDEISGGVLSKITELMGIRPEAVRVALHRLRKDGWIISQKSGRTSNYRLSDTAFSESLAARIRIYDRVSLAPRSWHLAVLQPMTQADRSDAEQRLRETGYVGIAPGVFLGRDLAPMKTTGCFLINGDISEIPDWLKQTNSPADLHESFARLESALTSARRNLDPHVTLSALEVATLRVLIVHSWRRLLFRQPPLPDIFFTKDWPGERCRKIVADMLETLERPKLANLHAPL